MSADRRQSVGFFDGNVGWLSGFSEEPDTGCSNEIKSLDARCRVCRVSGGVETSGESQSSVQKPWPPVNLLRQLDLNDVSNRR